MPTDIANPICEDVLDEPPPEGSTREWQTHLRGIVRLLQCPACCLPLKKPVTLPCGKSFCQRCIPSPYKRENVSWPGTAARQWGICCPDINCSREHAQEDFSRDIVLRRVVEAVEDVLQKEIASPLNKQLYTKVFLDDPPRIDMDDPPMMEWTIMKGGILLSAYKLAVIGVLKRSSNPKFEAHGCDAEAAKPFDEELLARIKSAVSAELNCEVCRIGRLVNPITTSCGHTFCEMCLYKSFYVINEKTCPTCRRRLSLPFGSKPNSDPEILNALLQHRDEVAEDRPTSKAEREGWDSIWEERPMIYQQAIYPSMATSLYIPETFRRSVLRALQGDRMLAVCAGITGCSTNVGTLVEILESHWLEDVSHIKVFCRSRFQVLDTRLDDDDGCLLVKFRLFEDISLADEEDIEIRETAGNPNKYVMYYKEDVPQTATKCLSGLATHVLHGCIRARHYTWLVEGAAASPFRPSGQLFPYDPVMLPWWFASIAPVTETDKTWLLGCRSVRERLQFCWSLLFRFRMDQFGLVLLGHD